jgi:G patch domain-containing protein 1
MTQYDFELETVEERRKRKTKEALEKGRKNQKDSRCIEGFSIAKNKGFTRKFFPPPRLPHDFKPVHISRKSRFEQPSATTPDDDGASRRGLGRHALSIQERQTLLGETNTLENQVKLEIFNPDAAVTSLSASSDGASKVVLPPEKDPSIIERVERIKKFVQVLQAHSVKTEDSTDGKPGFKPFMKNPEKQERYEKYLTLVSAGFQGKV